MTEGAEQRKNWCGGLPRCHSTDKIDDMLEEPQEKSAVAQKEEEILKFWKENKIFEKSLEKSHRGEVTFYDGPPFATGLPHYGHILAGTIKDVIPRFETMRGKRVLRRWGWDCHGLPIENLIEGELGLKNKKDIEDYGIEKFNEAARASVFRYDKEWREIVPRSGRWVDMDDQYITMSPSYMESVWWSFAELYKKGLVYEGFKSMHLCPRCETTLANFEVAQGYKDITDISVTAKFKVKNPEKIGLPENSYFLAWTTTPWTLPGNVALAVGQNIEYTVWSQKDPSGKVETYVVASLAFNRMQVQAVTVTSLKGKDLVKLEYEALFDYYTDKEFENKENAWKVYAADFVSTEEGTGIVHIAPAFGEDDLNLSQKEKLPVIQHVGRDGKFVKEVTDFAGMDVKPKSDSSTGSGQVHQKADIEIIKFLAHKNLLFSKEKIIHSYPHCWRCDTPLLNYASNSWFVEVTKYKDKFIRENKKVNWVPKEIGEGRFGNWLEGARDWAISRSRFWGATLPVWKCEECARKEVVSSVEELKKKVGKRNRYIVMRHGEAESNVGNFISSDNSVSSHLTEKGKKETEKAADKLKKEKIDVIISSPLFRTKETSDIVASAVGGDVLTDKRLEEVQTGVLNGKPVKEYQDFASVLEKFQKAPEEGETLTELKNRLGEFLYETDKKYEDKTILIIAHEYSSWLLFSLTQGANAKQSAAIKREKRPFLKNAEWVKLSFIQIPHNINYEVDLHRPYIDEVTFSCQCGKEMRRISDVFDTWYESGSMPYASHHYPFEKSLFNPSIGKRFPADFIAEGVDQTRGWFYSLLMLSTALFGKSPYKNVVVNGTILTEDGQKMSKRLKNYPEVGYILNKYGADAMRYYMISSPVVRAGDFAFSEKGVDEVVKKIILRLSNVCSFYEMYKEGEPASPKSPHILDKWILSRLSEVIEKTTKGLKRYELDVASRPFLDFVDDLSVWYLRRSRERFKGENKKDKHNATITTRFVLKEFAKALAPFMPFIAEDIYSRVKEGGDKESVHLEGWPKVHKVNKGIISQMIATRKIVSLALEARADAGIKVRQPLCSLFVKETTLKGKDECLSLIKDEVNVKEIVFQETLGKEVELDIEITPELKEEGTIRDFMRVLQDDRKKKGLTPKDIISLKVSSSEKGFILKWEDEIKRVVGISSIDFQNSDLPTSFESSGKSFSYALVV